MGAARSRGAVRGSGRPGALGAPVFVYGTLRDPARLRAVLGPGIPWRVIGAGTVSGRLYDLGAYPGLRPARRRADRVPGLLLEVGGGALERLDAYEGVAEGLYRRVRCRVTLASGGVRTAWVYRYLGSVAGRRRIPQWPP